MDVQRLWLSSCHIYKSYERPEVQNRRGVSRYGKVNDTPVSDTANWKPSVEGGFPRCQTSGADWQGCRE